VFFDQALGDQSLNSGVKGGFLLGVIMDHFLDVKRPFMERVCGVSSPPAMHSAFSPRMGQLPSISAHGATGFLPRHTIRK
jgi:hypothetical protein